MTPEIFEKQVRETIRKYDLFSPGAQVLVGLSGGPDSTCLLVVLSRMAADFPLALSALYADHGLRDPEEIGRERSFCADLCTTLGVPLDTVSLDLSGNKRVIDNLQQRARTERYKALQVHARSVGADRIAVGHTLDDQAETILMRLIRGSGRKGLSGIPARRDNIVRPLLERPRGAIEAYLETSGFTAMVDSSNLKETYLRNRLRSRLVPTLEALNPNIRETLVRTARILSEEDECLERFTEQAFEGMDPAYSASGIRWVKDAFDAEHIALRRRIIIRAVRALLGHTLGLTTGHVDAALRSTLQASPRTAQLPGGLVLRREHRRYHLLRSGQEFPEPDGCLSIPGSFEMRNGLSVEARVCAPGEPLPRSTDETLVPRQLLDPVLRIRTRRPGDFFYPLGMKGRKKLQDFFVDAKVPVSERDRIPLVISGDRIVWIAGHRLDHRFRCDPHAPGETVRLTLHRRRLQDAPAAPSA